MQSGLHTYSKKSRDIEMEQPAIKNKTGFTPTKMSSKLNNMVYDTETGVIKHAAKEDEEECEIKVTNHIDIGSKKLNKFNKELEMISKEVVQSKKVNNSKFKEI